MEEEVHKKKASLISVVILFLILILITILFIKKLEAPDIDSENLSLVDTDSKEYIASKKMEIDSYISSLNELYGINVLYGEDTINYANKVDATVETDLNIVNNKTINFWILLPQLNSLYVNNIGNTKEKKEWHIVTSDLISLFGTFAPI